LERWRELAARSESMDVETELSDLTFLVIGRVLMNGELDAAQAAELRCPFDIAANEAPRLQTLGSPELVDRDPAAEEFRRSLALVHEIVRDFVARRRANPGEPDILSRLIEAGADENTGFDDDELRDQIKTLFYAGHETTARSASFALLTASQRPDVSRKLHEDAAGLDAPGSLLERLARLRYTDAFVKEVLRLCPPLWSLERRALVDDSVRGYRIPEGSSVVLSLAVTHEHPEFWDDPAEFRPERFLSENCPRHRLAYFPFGGGARLCVGNHMAMLQLKLMMAMVYRELHFELAPGFTPEITPDLLYRFKAGLVMRPLGW
ncbi:MAG TPA: cytochrome P450, partial [Polyangiaceae bacterium]|nr:cytochrome P450 [Polyangiaceae bacterium]